MRSGFVYRHFDLALPHRPTPKYRSIGPLLPSVLLTFLFFSLAGSVWSAEGGYLSELAAEVEKVEEQTLGEADAPGVAPASADDPSKANTDASREAFELKLRDRYMGSYGFYKRLPERSRQEVFEEYRQGADMKQIRKKIISRLLNR